MHLQINFFLTMNLNNIKKISKLNNVDFGSWVVGHGFVLRDIAGGLRTNLKKSRLPVCFIITTTSIRVM